MLDISRIAVPGDARGSAHEIGRLGHVGQQEVEQQDVGVVPGSSASASWPVLVEETTRMSPSSSST